MRELFSAAQALLPRTALWSLHTSSAPDPGATNAHVTYDRVLHTKSDIRRLAHEHRMGLADWEAIAHLGWPRFGGVAEGSFVEQHVEGTRIACRESQGTVGSILAWASIPHMAICTSTRW